MKHCYYKFLVFLSIVFFGFDVQAQVAAIDPGFVQTGTGVNNTVNTHAVQPDNKVIIGGSFTTYNGVSRNRIARLKADGTLDETFIVGTGFDAAIYDLAIQSDGKIIVVGNFDTYNGVTNLNNIVRLNSDGSLDPSFSIGNGLSATSYSVALQSDGKIVVGGSFTNYNGTLRNRIVRLNSDGSNDNTFSPSSGFNNTVYSVAVQSDGKILVGGSFTTVNGQTSNRIARLNSNGTTDTGFGIGTGFNSTVNSIALQSTGKIVVGGAFTLCNGITSGYIARLNATGLIDTASFESGTGFSSTINSIAIQSDDRILATGSFTTFNGSESRVRIARLNSTGDIDYTFNPSTGLNSIGEHISVMTDGRIVASGSFSLYNGTAAQRVVRILSHTIQATSVSPTGVLCAGEAGQVSFTISGTFNASNVFTAQLSNATGSFASPVNIGTVASTIGGTMPFTIPTDAVTGTAYRIRIIASDPQVTGTDLGATSNISITAAPVPTNTISATPNGAICSGTTVNFTAVSIDGGSSPVYTWKLNGTAVGTNSNTYTDATLEDGDVVTCDMQSNAACALLVQTPSNAITMVVNPTDAPSISITANPTGTICAGDEVIFTADAQDAGGSPTYQWKLNGSNAGTGISTFTTTALQDGDEVVCTVFSSSVCSNPVSVTSTSIITSVSSATTPSVTVTADFAGSICSGDEVTFTATPTNGGLTPSYAWAVNGSPVGSDSDVFTTTSLQDGDEVTCVLTTSEPCPTVPTAASTAISVVVTPASSPTVSVTAVPSLSICTGTTVNFTATPTDEGTAPSYAWTVNDNPVGTDSDSYTSATLADGDVVVCIITSNAPCASPGTAISAPSVMSVSDQIVPSVSVSSDPGTSICVGESVTFTALPVSGGSTPFFQWKLNGDPVGTDSDTYTSGTLADGDLISVILVSNEVCANPNTVESGITEIAVNTILSASGVITGPTTNCQGETVTYSIEAVNGATGYTWILPAGWAGTSTTTSVSATAGAAGGTISVTADNACGSSIPLTLDITSAPNYATLSGTVTINGAPVISGWVYTYLQSQPEWWQAGGWKADSTAIVGGNYQFAQLPIYTEPYMLKAVANSSTHPSAIPTLYATFGAGQDTSSHRWDDAALTYYLTSNCGQTDVRNIHVLSSSTEVGQAILSGNVYWGEPPGKTQVAEDPIPLIDVVVEKSPPGNAFSHDVTDNLGYYEFTDVPAIPVEQFYRIYIAFPGIPMVGDGHEIIVTPEDEAFTDLNFYVDTLGGQILAYGPNSIKEEVFNLNAIQIMPNPMRDQITIVLPVRFGTATSYRMMAVDGKIVAQHQLRSTGPITVERGTLPSGIYFIEVTNTDGLRRTAKVVVQ
jgi:uncharacterized delta-60 repeat protein